MTRPRTAALGDRDVGREELDAGQGPAEDPDRHGEGDADALHGVGSFHSTTKRTSSFAVKVTVPPLTSPITAEAVMRAV